MKTYLVGGAVRDSLMGKKSIDRDFVVVGSSEADMLNMGFKKVGADFPVFLHPKTGEEHALARIERKTGIGYGGFTVETEGVTLEDDLRRRDLTINSIAQDVDNGAFIDPTGGIEDLRNKVLRANAHFHEDPLRVIRLARFASRYDTFSIHDDTADLAKSMIKSGQLNELSKERFWAELEKSVNCSDWGYFFELLIGWGADEHVNFFRDLLQHYSYSTAIARTAQQTQHPLIVFAAASALTSEGLKRIGASTAVLDLHRDLLRYKSATTPYDLYNLVEGARGFTSYGQINMLKAGIIAMIGTNGWGDAFIYSIDEIANCLRNAKKITAATYPHLEGKELGEAIRKGRIEEFERTIHAFKRL
jgi:tRNA nucleotidyltransferase/poly(A) polymerase